MGLSKNRSYQRPAWEVSKEYTNNTFELKHKAYTEIKLYNNQKAQPQCSQLAVFTTENRVNIQTTVNLVFRRPHPRVFLVLSNS